MDDSQTIAQMAQFSALEATQQLQQTIQQSNNVQAVFQAGALIGNYVQAAQSDGTDVTGAVTGVDFTSTNGVMTPTLKINNTDVDYSTIVKVSTTPISSTSGTSSKVEPEMRRRFGRSFSRAAMLFGSMTRAVPIWITATSTSRWTWTATISPSG